MSDHEFNNFAHGSNYNYYKSSDDEFSEDEQSPIAVQIIIPQIISTPSSYYPLNNSWVLYDHVKSDSDTYESNTRKICEISDIIKFWQVFNNYPLPSKIFNNGIHKSIMNSKEVSSISVFKKGIIPKWEDPANINGAEISKRKFNKKTPLEELDDNWITLLMMCTGGSIITPSITGLRVVDSSSFKKNEITGQLDFKLLYRIELWFNNCNRRQVVETYFKNILNIDDARLIHYKEHKNTD